MTVIISKLHASVGVEIAGVGDVCSKAHTETVRDAVHHHGCALMRRLNFGPDQLNHIAYILGEPLAPYRPQYSLAGWPNIIRIGNIRHNGQIDTYLNRGGVEWHTDSPGSTHPPGYSLLYCVESEVPGGGGETGFASTVSGYAALPDRLKSRIEDLELAQSFNTFNDLVAGYQDSSVRIQDGELRVRNADTLDRMVQTHPATGERHLYVSHAMIKAVPGMELSQAMNLVMEVVSAATAPALVYKHVWRPGDLVIFDNRSCLHTPYPYAFDDFPRTRRLLYQIIIGGRPGSEGPAQ